MEEIQEITWKELKEFVNSIPEDFLSKKASLLLEDDTYARKLSEPFFIQDDIYCNKEDSEDVASVKDLKDAHGEDFNIDDYFLITKKGTPFLYIS
jgi:hypothetical protein